MSQSLVSKNTETHGVSAILFASLLWGTTGTAASLAPNLSPLAIGPFSMGVGGLMLAIVAAKHLRNDAKRLIKESNLLWVGAIALALYPLAFYSSMRLAGVAIGTVVSIASAPFFVAVIECLFSKEHSIDRQWVLSFIIGALGISLLTFSETNLPSNHSEQADKYIGICLGFMAGFTYALYSWAAKGLIKQGVSAQSAMGSIFGFGAVLLLPILAFTGRELFATSMNTAVALYMAVIPMFLGYVCFGYGLKSVCVSKACLLTLFEPAVATVFAVVIVGESISLAGWVGVIFIMLCLLLQSYKP
ncbi:EamA family transporter [Vibrio sp. Of7-15]|uniref:DMT family transporter n=1 Tax=Vibrio sp. Of7-15 TaxID=2724879 RepID=UPI001EF20E27|nr:EamA family transporter [Vibrio sp. Of7-15]MCG7499796.1 EamA family transporter [Vibrio sp. Of7-15]